MKQTSAEARIITLESQLGIYSQPKKDDAKIEEETPEDSMGENQRESCSNLPGHGWQLQGTWLTPWVIKGNKVNMICVDNDAVSCASVLAEQFGA